MGRLDVVEDRLVGIKSREIYEAPGAMVLITAHTELEHVTLGGSWAGSSGTPISAGPSWCTTGCGIRR